MCVCVWNVTGEVDPQLHGCLLSMGGDQSVAGVTHHLTNYAAAAGASFTRRENSISNDVRRQAMVHHAFSL